MDRWTLLALALSTALLWGCTQEAPPPEATPPPPEDLSTWSAPALMQQSAPLRQSSVSEEHKPTSAEKLYEFAPGGTYLAPVMVGFPLDILFERGEEIRNYSGGDPELLEQGQQANRWEVKPGASGHDATMRPHLFLRATEPGLKMGLVITTTKRIYYLTCASVKASPIRAIRWKYADEPLPQTPPAAPSLLPHPETPRQYHVGYQLATSQPTPPWVPRHIVDDGTKLYLVYPEITLFKSVPLVRKIGPHGPQLVNSRQFLNTVILDELPARVELRVGTGTSAETATITQGHLRTISCPGDPECPVWPAAAIQISARERMATIPTTPPPQIQRQLATRTHGKRIALLVLLIFGGAIAGAASLLRTKGKPLTEATVAAPTARPWLKQAETYPDPEKPVDTIAPELARLRNELLAMKLKIEELDKRKTGTTVVQPQPPAQSAAKPPEKRPAQMLYYHKDIQDKITPVRTVMEYTLAPWATKLPCTIEPLMNSDVEGYFTAKVNTNVYDTATGRHLLVPQGATIGGRDHASTLLYGNERLPTTSLALTIGDRTYDLGQAPMMDQLGTNGLTGEVDQHYWRLFGAIFIGGALRGGQQMLQMEMAQAGGAGQIATGIAGLGNQAASQRIGRALDTRPTIKVFPGQPCQVLLLKPLALPAVWQ